jgi:hypothetical protein
MTGKAISFRIGTMSILFCTISTEIEEGCQDQQWQLERHQIRLVVYHMFKPVFCFDQYRSEMSAHSRIQALLLVKFDFPSDAR